MKKYFAGLASALVLAATAHAEQVTYNYSGYVSAIYKYDHSQPWPMNVSSVLTDDGTVTTYLDFHGQISYDTSTPMQAGPEWGPTYSGASPLTSASLSFDNSSVSYQSAANSSELQIIYKNPYLSDQFRVVTAAGDRTLEFNFTADNEHVLNGSRIPGYLNQFTSLNGFYFGGSTQDGNTFTAFGAITSLDRVSAVPEPETWGMLVAGLALIGWRQRRKQRC
ncbi:PEP-CTERM sorting domain-containing protein [Duganella dendranthematis]|uniref:PEP-CTERM sorting domain-containing protein n=1 Tax=Duganella dendranthematis TaxID=2728021 RepID=A0ABX6MAP9_9BURK|nr:PEP-CTERM sorting domain-containing protein [Duganella dendranthematis]QJD91401.1 PEP-CTERM sorting domain-containing protein [Duganella dendranthematis]